jgi:hypothetical protein
MESVDRSEMGGVCFGSWRQPRGRQVGEEGTTEHMADYSPHFAPNILKALIHHTSILHYFCSVGLSDAPRSTLHDICLRMIICSLL